MFFKLFGFLQKMVALTFMILAVASLVYNLPTNAQTNTNTTQTTTTSKTSSTSSSSSSSSDATTELLTFTGCQIPKTASEGSKVVLSCLSSISRFIFIVGIVSAGISFAVFTVQSYIPGQSVDTFKNAQETIRNLVIGMILIGAPASILSLLNSGALNLDFLSNLNKIRENTNSSLSAANKQQGTLSGTNGTTGSGTGTGTGTTNGSGTGTGSGTNTGSGSGSGTNTNSGTSGSGNTNPTNSTQNETSYKVTTTSVYTSPQLLDALFDTGCQTITFVASPQVTSSNQSTSDKVISIRVCQSSKYGFTKDKFLPLVINEKSYPSNLMSYEIPSGQTFTLSALPSYL